MSTPQWPNKGESGGQPVPGGPYGAPGSQQPSAPYPPGGYSGGPGGQRPPAGQGYGGQGYGGQGYSGQGYSGQGQSGQGQSGQARSGGQAGYAAPPAQGYQQPRSGQNSYGQAGYGQNSYSPPGSADETVYTPSGYASDSYSSQPYTNQPYGSQTSGTGSAHIIAGILLLIGGLAAAVVAGLVWLEVGAVELFGAIFGAGLPNLFQADIDADIILTISVVFGLLTAILAVILMRRVAGVRIPLAIVGVIGTLYYAYQVIYYLTDEFASEYLAASDLIVPVVALLIWLAGTVVTLLPATARAVR